MKTRYTLSIESLALERCFWVADILAQAYEELYSEYGMVGLATQHRPFRVVATPLLPGQKVNSAKVYEDGHNVFKLKSEIEKLSKYLGQPLIPITFIHRHPGACGLSSIDERFLTGTFLDQVSTILSWDEHISSKSSELSCDCLEKRRVDGQSKQLASRSIKAECAISFSLIINRDREFSIDAARKIYCPYCKARRVDLFPASLDIGPKIDLSRSERRKLWKALELEIEEKLEFDS